MVADLRKQSNAVRSAADIFDLLLLQMHILSDKYRYCFYVKEIDEGMGIGFMIEEANENEGKRM